MATRGKSDNKTPDWKERYVKQASEYDALKSRYREHLELLQRLVSRLVLQIDDSDATFNKEIQSLRSCLKGEETSLSTLGDSLKRIDHLLLSQQESAEQGQGPAPGGVRNSEKGLAWSRLANTVKSFFHSDPHVDTGLKKPRSGPSQSHFEDLPPVDEMRQALESTPGYGAISSKVAEHLNNLLDQLDVPDSAAQDLEEIRLRIKSRVNWYELPPTLEDLGRLVGSVVGAGQRDFDQFLTNLDSQLQGVGEFLDSYSEQGQKWEDVRQEFEKTMADHRDDLIKLSVEAENSSVQESIRQHLEQISLSVMQAIQQGESMSNELQPKLQTMREKLLAMDSEQKTLRQRLKEQRKKAGTDALTGLPSRESFEERMEFEFQRWRRYPKGCTLVMGELDTLESIEERYGAPSGDRTLQIVAKELQQRIRITDFIARHSRGEFALILPETETVIARDVVEKLRSVVSSLPFHFRDQRLQVTMSFGVVGFSDCEGFDILLARVEQALTDAREAGRNCVKVWDSSPRKGDQRLEVESE